MKKKIKKTIKKIKKVKKAEPVISKEAMASLLAEIAAI